MPRSSTSSSEPRRAHWPIAGPLAALLVLAIDALVFRVFSPWQALSANVDHWYYEQSISDRLVIEALAGERAGRRLVVLMGTSRMEEAWRPALLESPVPDTLEVMMVAHARIFPTEIRAAADVMRSRAPDVVVLGISELDTHVPVMLDRRTSFPGATLYFEAAHHLGMGWLFAEREDLYRSALGSVIAGYRYRELLGKAGLDRLRRFPSDRLPRKQPLLDSIQEQVLAEFEDREEDGRSHDRRMRRVRAQIVRMDGVRAGPHADAQLDFLRRAAEILRAAGSEVVIVELPIYPSAKRLYDASLRADFLALVAELERDLAVRVIRLEDQPVYERRDFSDLTHVGRRGAKKVSQTILAAILAAADEAVPADSDPSVY